MPLLLRQRENISLKVIVALDPLALMPAGDGARAEAGSLTTSSI